MKKKFLLAFLPAVLILSGCNPLSSYAAAGTDLNVFAEDTELHSEIFGDLPEFEHEAKGLVPLRAPDTESGLYKPVLGFQKKYDSSSELYSIRFVAAIQPSITSAQWRRSVHNATSVEKSPTYKNVEKVYGALNEGGDLRAYATDEVANDATKPFEFYAVYCLLNIPASFANNDYYVSAFINVSDGSKNQDSDIGCVNIKTGERMKFYFGDENEKDVAVINGKIRKSDAREGNKVAITPIHLNANDEVEIYHFDEDNLRFNKKTGLNYGSGGTGDMKDFQSFSLNKTTDVLTAQYTGDYKIYCSSTYEFFFQKAIYLRAPTGWGTDKQAKVQFVNTENNWWPEYSMESTDESSLFVYWLNSTYFNNIQFFQQTGETRSDWTGYKGDSFLTDKNLFTIAGWGDDVTKGSWSVYGE